MFNRFKSADDKFFDLFEQGADCLCEGASLLMALMDKYDDTDAGLQQLIEIEHRGDKVNDKIFQQLNETFMTPFDREDLYTLARMLDDILDSMCSTLEKMVLYETGKPDKLFRDLVDVFIEATKKVRDLVYHLRDLKHSTVQIMDLCYEVKRLENEGDKRYRLGIAALFKNSTNAIEVVKWKEVFEQMETALDKCETISKLIRGVVVKYA